MRNKKIGSFVCTLLISSVLLSSMAIAELTYIDTENSLQVIGEESTDPIVIPDNDMDNTGFRFVVWDNCMEYNDVVFAYYNETTDEYIIEADDFIFDEETEVLGIHWIGGFFGENQQQPIKEWKIIFYEDKGDGKAPGNIFAGPFNYSNDQCNPELIEDLMIMKIYEYSVNLSGYISFTGNTKFWISIWAKNFTGPLPILGAHNFPIKINSAVYKTDTGIPEWNDIGGDLCFQLTTVVDYIPPKIKIIKPERGIYLGDKKRLPLILRTTIIGKITIQVDATDDESGIAKVEFYGGLFGNKKLGEDTTAPYNFTWERDRIRLIHLHTLKIVVYDLAGNTAVKKMRVRKIL